MLLNKINYLIVTKGVQVFRVDDPVSKKINGLFDTLIEFLKSIFEKTSLFLICLTAFFFLTGFSGNQRNMKTAWGMLGGIIVAIFVLYGHETIYNFFVSMVG